MPVQLLLREWRSIGAPNGHPFGELEHTENAVSIGVHNEFNRFPRMLDLRYINFLLVHILFPEE
jgi:hypothetical protein